MHFILDENLPREIADLLRDQGHDVLEVADSPLRSSDDLTIWRWAAQEGRILVTKDLGFPLQGISPSPPGLVLIRAPNRYTTPNLVRLLQQSLEDTDVQDL